MGEDFPALPVEILIPAYTNSTYLVCVPFPFILTDDCSIEFSESFRLCLQANGLDYRVVLSTDEPRATITDDDSEQI